MSKRTLIIIRTEGAQDIVLRDEELSAETRASLMRDVVDLINRIKDATEKLNEISKRWKNDYQKDSSN